jgi:glutamate-ammonia-ligase adenylyltransferase
MAHSPQHFPRPADPAAAARLRADFAARGAAEQKFAVTAAGRAVLDCLGGNAPYLADLACRDSAAFLATMKDGPAARFEALLAELRQTAPGLTRQKLGVQLRQTKRRAALAIALADLGGIWTLEQITGALSELAESACAVVIDHLLRSLHDAGQIVLPDPATPARDCGFVALALGKLGARELNYSSDIDLVLLFDPQNPAYGADVTATMARFARDLVTLLSTRDEEGYVFRVDLRLRPNPAATPPVVSLPAALRYYESQGRTWERAAFSKARPIAGDLALGQNFLAAIKPFIWRKNLDFSAIGDIHDMKRKIDARSGTAGLLGRDVKLGKGGIREIEFIVQTLSLVWAGQDSALRIPATLQALPALAKAGHLPAADARSLATDYRELRRVEHRLQMVADRQTHALPATDEALAAFMVFLDAPDFLTSFPALLERVHGHFLGFFDAGHEGPAPDTDFRHGPAGADFAAHLQKLGFADIKHVTERLRDWADGGIPALRADRARDMLQTLLPKLLAVLGAQPEPDKAFANFDILLSRQQAGVPLLALFQRNPLLLQRVIAVLGAAPALAEHLAQDAQALETLLVPSARFEAPKPILHRMLREAEGLEEAVAVTRRFVRREEFHLSVATFEGRIDIDRAGALRSALAAAALSGLLPRVLAQHQARYGKLPGAAFAVVALGKAGSGEMLAGSDLDLMFLYDHAPAASPPTQYFVRLAHAMTAALTAQGPEGPLYRVDMRLRPSGNQGPVAVSMAAFSRYHGAESWTWERLALTRAKIFAATPKFAPRVRAALLDALTRPQTAPKIRENTAAMRDRLLAEKPPLGPYDVKNRPGGMLEVSFIAAALQLIFGPAAPELFIPNTAAALRALAAAGHLAPADKKTLIAADFLWRSIQGMIRIMGMSERAATPPGAMIHPLLRITGAADLAALQAEMATSAAAVQNCFTRIIIKGES